MKTIFAAAAALTLFALPALADDGGGRGDGKSIFYQAIPAHKAVPDLAQDGPAGDAEAHAQNVYRTIGTYASGPAVTATDASQTRPKVQVPQDDSWRNQP